MKEPKNMTRSELEEEVVLLRQAASASDAGDQTDILPALLKQRQEGDFVSLTGARAKTAALLKRKSEEISSPAIEDGDRLAEFLSNLGRLSTRFAFVLEARADGEVAIVPRDESFGGYAAVLDSETLHLCDYQHGKAPEGPNVVACGNDMHPTARVARAKAWQEENADAIAEHNRLMGRWDRSLP